MKTIKTYTIDGINIPLIEVPATTDVRFFSQRQLFRLGTPGAVAELAARARIINGRKG